MHSILAPAAITDPRALANLEAWFRADDTIDVGGGVISQWNDRSGNGRHASQGTAGNRGSRTTSASLRNQAVVALDGNDYYTTSAFSLPRACTWFVVVGSITTRGMLVEHGLGDSIYCYADGNAALSAFGPTGIGYHRAFKTNWIAADSQGSARYDQSAAPTLRTARAAVTPTSTDGTAQASASYSKTLTLGARSNGTLPHTGELAEVIVYSRALSAAEIVRIEAYLFARYGV